jgi:hypothetical protein
VSLDLVRLRVGRNLAERQASFGGPRRDEVQNLLGEGDDFSPSVAAGDGAAERDEDEFV